MDIVVSPGASERYKIMDAIRDGYARHADKIPSGIKDINRNNAVEKIAEIAKQMDLKSIIDKRAEKWRGNRCVKIPVLPAIDLLRSSDAFKFILLF